ncbi:NAD-dependent succinate-semialdehyde dehydrogenase [Curtobacterium pusillum]|uniref:NAD-dependent succinate-semialdehyde dehydrogenase n=1 Tax=Curtobacterium pusillum TaxID=69373 RepID=A0ABX2M8Q1_9MICO|nr:NAD-dependent succinate-semialdehyde dehydrogenase [Curtobacterium pusillum]NUU14236.1 NAD-dependent succinate-semialdehyde dehydrogenase [Curtobacterium pusillum]GLK30655.1 NAD-dependent succinate-semialdehyde dehydrogenase [Curtobacterium pusillum]
MTDVQETTDATAVAREVAAGVPTGLLIGGGQRTASDGGTFDVHNPVDGSVLATVANGTRDDAQAAVDAAGDAAAAWAATPPRKRSEVLSRAYHLMIERADWFAKLITAENGKVFSDARGEVVYAAEFLRWYAEEAVRIPGSLQTAPGGANKILVEHRPIGIAILVTPWNFPAAMATRKIGPALAAGCTMVLKPASDTPLTALAIGALFEEAGLPAGVLNVLPSRSSGAVVEQMVRDPRSRKLSFTGSTEVGVKLMQLAAESVVNTSMELGGNAPFVVFDDADLDEAVAGAMIAKMRNGGEACTAANRFYVQSGIAAEFSGRLADAMGALRTGDGLDPEVQLGPMVNETARDDIARLVEAAKEDGATVLTGGTAPDGAGWFYPATVLGDVPEQARILQEEIFGPVAPVVTFETEDDAVRLANGTPFGLVSYVYTRDIGRGLRVSERIESGMVGLNRGLVSDPAAPFGGMKESGIGREGGAEGLLEYMESQYIAVAW